MSFHFLEVDLSTVFEPGQAYVAVSRSMSVEGLRITACRERMPKVSQLVIEFYSTGIVTASELNVDGVLQSEKKRDITITPMINVDECTSVPSTATEPQMFVVDQLYSDSDMCINEFCKWLWHLYEQMHQMNENVTLMDRKKFSGVTKQLHSLYRSSQLLWKWKECSESEVDIGIGGKDRKAAVVYSRAVYAEFLNRQAKDSRNAYFNDPSLFEQGPVQYTTKEAQGKIRDLSGWVISEEIKACISYVNHHKCSKSTKVAKKS